MTRLDGTKLVVTPDSTALQLESGGKVDFASPTGAPFTAQLWLAGWIPLVTPLDVLTNMPAGPGSQTAAGMVDLESGMAEAHLLIGGQIKISPAIQPSFVGDA